MEGVKPPPPVRLKDYSVALPPSRPNLVVVRSSPSTADDFASQEEELQAREDQALQDGQGRAGGDGGRPGVASSSPRGTWSSSSRTSPSTRTPTSPPPPSPTPLAAVVKLCLGAGARKVIVADNPINNPESCFFKTKVGEAAVRAGAELMLPQGQLLRAALRRRRDDHRTPGRCSTGPSARPPRSSASRR